MLDATFVIDYLRGDGAAIARFAQMFQDGDQPVVNDVVACEVRTGMRDADLHWLEAFLEPLEFVRPGAEVALLAGEWRAGARHRGYSLTLPDALIAATAHALGATVLTRNVRDFALTPAVVEAY